MPPTGSEQPPSAEVPQAENRGSKRFRFKEKQHEKNPDDDGSERRRRHRHHHRHHYRSKRRKTSPSAVDDPSAYDDSVPSLPPDTAFRESLFDALGDDEGASFWEGVYGQPIHTYPNTYQNRETGELERMDDEEYAQYVRRKMWEKSWEGIEAAREQKRKDREQQKQRIREEERKENLRENRKQEPDYLFDLEIERSLHRGRRRKERQYWESLWEHYLQQWETLHSMREAQPSPDAKEDWLLRNKIAWPVESGKRKDLSSNEIERFVRLGAEPGDESDDSIGPTLKFERVRWHPDKIQQHYGFMEIDEDTMQGVTAVFQVLDRMWSELRDRKG